MSMRITIPINGENVTQACAAVNRESGKLERKRITRRLITVIGYMSFVAVSMLLLTGVLYHIGDASDREAMDSIPVVGLFAAFAEEQMFGGERPVLHLGVLAAVVQYVLPVAICGVLALLGQLLGRTKPLVTAEEEPARAKQLHAGADALYQKWLGLGDSSRIRLLCNYLFTLYTLYVLVMMVVRLGWPGYGPLEIIGAIVAFVVWHLLYKLVLALFVAISKLFYRCKNPLDGGFRAAAKDYLRGVDPNAVKEEPEAATSVTRQEQIVHIDPFTWTTAYAQSNEEKCGDTAMNYVEIAKSSLSEGDYEQAAMTLDRAAYALELLSRTRGGEQYVPYLYANQYASSRVYAFGLGDRDAAKFRLEQAVKIAGTYAVNKHPDYERAIRDFKVMNGVLEEFNKGTSLAMLKEYYGSEFPYDIT